MPDSTRILVVDSDATSQGDVQGILVSRRFVVLGGADLGEETVTMARTFQPQVILLNLDNGPESYGVACTVASELPEARLIAYTRRKDIKSVEQSARAGFEGRPVKVVPASEKALLAAIESALTGEEEETPEEETPEEQAPVVADDEHEDMGPSPQVDSASPVVPPWSGASAEPFLRYFADLASEWLLTRSPQAEERLMAILAEDVQAPSFGGHGRDAVRRGLQGLAWRLGSDFRLIPSDLDGGPVLAVMVETRDGQWHRAGHFVVGIVDDSTVSYFDYREDEPSEEPEPEVS